MPYRGDPDALVFDPKYEPRKICQYFRSLEDLFTVNGITRDSDKREYVLDYVEYDVEEFWEFRAPLVLYADFVKKVLSFYMDTEFKTLQTPAASALPQPSLTLSPIPKGEPGL
ncbi:hypothetical protein BD779DRAFT_1672108 [Infundibulicybe gibba]|nr:hypothetical protein BD779DRAFT_1672108 [Infundibulicybe gibba]